MAQLVNVTTSLDGFGHRILGGGYNARLGNGLDAGGDVNGDGIPDIILGAIDGNGGAYVIFGSAFSGDIDIGGLNGGNGFRLVGEAPGDSLGAVALGGDFNGDGIDDILFGARENADAGLFAGAAYVVFGGTGGFGASVDLGAMGAGGFKIAGAGIGHFAGTTVASAGDVDGDGIDDILVGANSNLNNFGTAFLIPGSAGPAADIGLGSFGGVTFLEPAEAAQAGRGLAGGGDINGDGIDDFIIGAPFGYAADTSGSAFVIFGQPSPLASPIDLSAGLGAAGFTISASAGAAPDRFGASVAIVGDVDGDGLADFVIGAPGRNGGAGAAYLVLGGSGLGGDITPATIAAASVLITSAQAGGTGLAVAAAGDFNGDGIDDFLVSSPDGSRVDVVFGRSGGFGAAIDLDALADDEGTRIVSDEAGDRFGQTLAAVGDLNGDGFDDIVIGAPLSAASATNSGAAYVIFGFASAGLVRTGTAMSDSLVGGGFADTLDGGDGDDTIRGAGGNDQIDAGEGDNVVDGGAGNDTIQAGDGNNRIDTGDGNNSVSTGTGNDTITGGAGNDTINSAGGSNQIDTGDGDNTVTTGGGNDTIAGGAGSDTINPGDGDNFVTGGGGNDVVAAGDGNNQIYGGDGDDTLSAGAGADSLFGNIGNDSLSGGDGDDVILGRFGNDTISGDADNDSLLGGAGDDLLNGGAGDDTLRGESGNDTLQGAAGDDMLFGGGGGDALNGGAGNDMLFGGPGADNLFGGDGNDTLDGGVGDDNLTGGPGADLFVFAAGYGADRIVDFEDGIDMISLVGVAGFAALTIVDTDDGALITFEPIPTTSIRLDGIMASQLDNGDFLFT